MRTAWRWSTAHPCRGSWTCPPAPHRVFFHPMCQLACHGQFFVIGCINNAPDTQPDPSNLQIQHERSLPSAPYGCVPTWSGTRVLQCNGGANTCGRSDRRARTGLRRRCRRGREACTLCLGGASTPPPAQSTQEGIYQIVIGYLRIKSMVLTTPTTGMSGHTYIAIHVPRTESSCTGYRGTWVWWLPMWWAWTSPRWWAWSPHRRCNGSCTRR